MFQFPANPTVGQLFSPIPGVTYRWSGTAWYLVGQTPLGVMGECIFTYVSTTQCILSRRYGSLLTINNAPRVVPVGGVFLGLADVPLNDTFYYVYAYWTGSTIALEASTVPPAQSSVNGQEVKGGDETRSLVGSVRKASDSFHFTNTAKYVRSWFNDNGLSQQITNAGNFLIPVSSTMNLISQALRVYGLFWESEVISMNTVGYGTSGTAGGATFVSSGIGANLDNVISIGPDGGANVTDTGFSIPLIANSIFKVSGSGTYNIGATGRSVVTQITFGTTGGFNFSSVRADGG